MEIKFLPLFLIASSCAAAAVPADRIQRALEYCMPQIRGAGLDIDAAQQMCKSDYCKICVAIQSDDVAGLRQLLKHGADPNLHPDGRHAVMDLAAYAPDVRVLQTMLEFGGNVNAEEGSKQQGSVKRALALGAGTGYWKNFEFLMAHSPDISIRSGSPPFTLPEKAVAMGPYDIANQLIDMGYDRELGNLLKYAQLRVVADPMKPEKARLIERLEAMLAEAERDSL